MAQKAQKVPWWRLCFLCLLVAKIRSSLKANWIAGGPELVAVMRRQDLEDDLQD
jgi:hypothetical protein